MPSSPAPTPGALTRTVAPLAPLAIALLVGHAILPSGGTGPTTVVNPADPTAPVKCGEVADFRQCHTTYPSGCSDSANYDGYLNVLKNQETTTPPVSSAVRFLTSLQDYQALESQTPPELNRSNHISFKDQLDKLGEKKVFGVIGYLYYAKESGKESSNCELGDHDAVDYHIGIGFDSTIAKQLTPSKQPAGAQMKTLEQTSVIVEMTPHYRFFYHPNWNIDVVKSVIGRQVRVTGQLMIDSEHNNATQNCGFSKADLTKCWRASSWELHPVMQFQVCKSDKCDATSGDWAELDQVSTPASKEATPGPAA